MNYFEAATYVNSYTKSGEHVKNLSRFERLMILLGNPQKDLKFVHVAGTNGKGSVCEYISSVLKEKGNRVGKFTSPYLCEQEERIQINGKNISKEALALLCGEVQKAVSLCEIQGFSQFEIIAAIGLLYFYKEEVDIIVLEAGIGGMFDCTNIITPEVSVITTIHYDHTEMLGETLQKISFHKAGIIKHGVRVVVSPKQPIEALQVINAKAEEQEAEIIVPDLSRLQVIHQDIYDVFFNYKGKNYQIKMAGAHQLFNALTAIEVCLLLGAEYGEIYSGIEKTKLPARLEIVQSNPTIIIDGAHNLSGINAAKSFLLQEKRSKIGIVGMLDTKDYISALNSMLSMFEQVVFVDYFSENAVKCDELCRVAKQIGLPHVCCSDGKLALEQAVQLAGEDKVILSIGSLYLAGDLRKLFMDK